ncbi:MAG: hercynine oxygenase [Planctomycetota bacterium]|nr:MAG: hercynine oxygenase [Planctomycetota bacterium]
MSLLTSEPAQLGDELARAWQRSDAIFALLSESAWLEQPIPLRHPFLFYLGHLPAFAWNHLGVTLLGKPALNAEFEDLFERGIDPSTDGTAPQATAPRWPERAQVEAYRDRVRAALVSALPELETHDAKRAGREAEQLLHAVLEHELMHHETLLYMLQALDHAQKRAPASSTDEVCAEGAPLELVEIPAGHTTLGAAPREQAFGWDNEFPAQRVAVPAFRIDSLPVSNTRFLEFVNDGGYRTPRWWSAEAWRWREQHGLGHPLNWRHDGTRWWQRTLFCDRPLEQVAHWPVSVSWAEAAAFAAWQGRRLPTEAEFQRAAYGTPSGHEHEAPNRVGASDMRTASLDFQRWSPAPVGSSPQGRSAFGVHELVGNGWEWTATLFAPRPGFRVTLPSYAGYSADFFDEPHYVMLGGSWATDARLLRRSFRNWFRPHYPWAFTKFRLVEAPGA